MGTLIKRILPILISSAILATTIWQIEPPKHITEITALQVLLVSTPMLTLMFFIANLFLNFWLRSLVVAVGLLLLIALKTLDQLNIITAGITLAAIYLLAKSCHKPSKDKLPIRSFKSSKLQKQR